MIFIIRQIWNSSSFLLLISLLYFMRSKLPCRKTIFHVLDFFLQIKITLNPHIELLSNFKHLSSYICFSNFMHLYYVSLN